MSNKVSSTEEFIKRAIKIHGYKFDYSQVEYKNNYTVVEIICRKHGGFFQRPASHLRGNGCKDCFTEKSSIIFRSTKEEFIEKAIKIHGTLYDYIKVIYITGKIEIEIICKKHGSFWQRPDVHLRGSGCHDCLVEKQTSNIEEFISKANIVHNFKFDYHKSIYINAKTLIEIVCKQCKNSFWQSPNSHLRGRGCNVCSNNQPLTAEKFIEKAIKVHGNLFSYKDIIYKNNGTKIKIFCNNCKTFFWQTPGSHLRGCGCPNCIKNIKLTTEKFIERAIKVHGYKFDYKDVSYINIFTKVKITCSKNHQFEQSPGSHLNGNGCPKCIHIISKPETQWLDSLNIPLEYRQFKINIDKKWFKVDGYEPITKTIYEFLGNYYHGNPRVFNLNEMNKRMGETYGELYRKTMERLRLFEINGYNVIYIWESDFVAV